MTITGKSGRKYQVENTQRGACTDSTIYFCGFPLVSVIPGTSGCGSLEEALERAEARADALKMEE